MNRFLCAFVFCLLLSSKALFGLAAGDIAFVQANYDDPDNFAFIALVNIPANEEIKFTDNGWESSGSFRTGEGTLTWIAPSGGLTAGTVVTITPTTTASSGSVTQTSGSFNLSASGDQILAYQGADSNPAFLAAINMDGTTWASSSTSSNNSALPNGLTNGVNAIAINEVDNAAFTGTITGTPTQILAVVNNPSNWSTSNTVAQNYSGGIVLPIELLSFKAKTIQGKIVLDWATATERDNKEFIVERAANPSAFAKIATIDGAGNAESQQDYSYVDAQPLSGKSYYRLRQVDFDGTESVSPVVAVDLKGKTNVSVYPNPAGERFMLALDENKDPEDRVFSLYNLQGQIVRTSIIQEGQTNQEVELNGLPDGTYFLREANNTYVLPVVKK